MRDRPSLDPWDVGTADGARVTWRGRTAFDCLWLLDEAAAIRLLDQALSRRWITLAELVERVRHHLGRPGMGQLVRVLRRASDGSRSPAERLLIAALGPPRSVAVDGVAGSAGVGAPVEIGVIRACAQCRCVPARLVPISGMNGTRGQAGRRTPGRTAPAGKRAGTHGGVGLY